jgi:hypothetical protein
MHTIKLLSEVTFENRMGWKHLRSVSSLPCVLWMCENTITFGMGFIHELSRALLLFHTYMSMSPILTYSNESEWDLQSHFVFPIQQFCSVVAVVVALTSSYLFYLMSDLIRIMTYRVSVRNWDKSSGPEILDHQERVSRSTSKFSFVIKLLRQIIFFSDWLYWSFSASSSNRIHQVITYYYYCYLYVLKEGEDRVR